MQPRYAILVACGLIGLVGQGIFYPEYAIWNNSFSLLTCCILAIVLALEIGLIYWKRIMYGVINKPSAADELIESIRDQYIYSRSNFRDYGLPDPSVHKLAVYIDGIESFGEVFTIRTEMGDFSGTCGISMESTSGKISKQTIDMIQVWLADEQHLRKTVVRFATSSAYRDADYGNTQLIRKGASVTHETDHFHLHARVVEEQTMSAGRTQIIDRAVIELAVWLKEHVTLETERV